MNYANVGRIRRILIAGFIFALAFTKLAAANMNEQAVYSTDTNPTILRPYTVKPDFAPGKAEAKLMYAIMKQVSKDYRTRNVTIAIDNFEASAENSFTDAGMIRVGGGEWKTINFDVTLGKRAKTAGKVVYKIEDYTSSS
jgi:hypothetical protein